MIKCLKNEKNMFTIFDFCNLVLVVKRETNLYSSGEIISVSFYYYSLPCFLYW